MTAFPVTRLRRLRRTDALRSLVRETRLDLDRVVAPLFACPGEGVVDPAAGLPGLAQRSVDELVREAGELHGLGIRAVLLFGIPEERTRKAPAPGTTTASCNAPCVRSAPRCPG